MTLATLHNAFDSAITSDMENNRMFDEMFSLTDQSQGKILYAFPI